MPKLKPTRPEKEVRERMVPVRFTDEEHEKASSFAKKFTNGNLSEWIRYATLNFEPKKRDMR